MLVEFSVLCLQGENLGIRKHYNYNANSNKDMDNMSEYAYWNEFNDYSCDINSKKKEIYCINARLDNVVIQHP